MTPAITVLKKAGFFFRIHEYEHEQNARSYGEEAAVKLQCDPRQVFKTLVLTTDKQRFALGLVPVSAQLDCKAFARAMGARKAALANAADARRITGYVLGGVSPLGQKKKLPTIIASCATDYATIFVSAGRRGLEIEITPSDLAALTSAVFAPIQSIPLQ